MGWVPEYSKKQFGANYRRRGLYHKRIWEVSLFCAQAYGQALKRKTQSRSSALMGCALCHSRQIRF
ncbi:hypothetical protein AAY53_05460 [Vibrio metoecus]|nr:hypothetical protein AAY53_05460 [Vibrio metoecus]